MNKEEIIQIALGIKFVCIECGKVKKNLPKWTTNDICVLCASMRVIESLDLSEIENLKSLVIEDLKKVQYREDKEGDFD